MLAHDLAESLHTEQAVQPQNKFADVLAFWQVAEGQPAAMDARQQSQVLMSELTRISAQQDNLKTAVAEAMNGAGDSFTVHGPLKSFALHEKEAQLVDEQPASPGIQAGWVEPEATPQARLPFSPYPAAACPRSVTDTYSHYQCSA